MKVETNFPTGMNFGDSNRTEEVIKQDVLVQKDSDNKPEPKGIREILENSNDEPLSERIGKKDLSIKIDDDVQVIEKPDEVEEFDDTPQLDIGLSNSYYDIAQSLIDDELIDLDDLEVNDYQFDDWSPKNFKEFIKKNIEVYKQKVVDTEERVAQETYDYVINQMSDITRRGYELESKNKLDIEDVKDFYRQLVYEADIKKLDPSDSIDAEQILIEYYRSQKKSSEYITDTIANLKDIVKEATKVKPELDKKLESIAEAKIEEQNAILAMDIEAKKHTKERLEKIFESGELDGITITKEIKNFLNKCLVDDEVEMNIRGKQVHLSGAEYLIRFHKFNKESGDLKHLAKMILYLQSPLLFEQHVINKVEARETNRKIKEHKESVKQTSNVPTLLKPKQVNTAPKGMVFSR